ncbi:MAG: hypothetical protein HN392_05200 [Anaerolineae bacterium]|jgi:hypothetical protein|nr:hypothetical protein [Anaerolineae bacterium]MBT7782157.1 hypothetical protein [Anaerolineae bacterium]
MDDILKAVVSAIIAYIVPRALGNIGKAFAPSGSSQRTLPWVQWVIASFIGGALGGAFSGAMGNQSFGNWAVYGAALGIMQWFALRGYLPIGGWWAVASAIGWAFAPLFGGNPFGGFIIGLAIGFLQTIGLNMEGKSWWIGGNALAWGLVALLLPLLVEPLGNAFGFVLGWIIGWGLVALLGAFLLLLPLSRLNPKPNNS